MARSAEPRALKAKCQQVQHGSCGHQQLLSRQPWQQQGLLWTLSTHISEVQAKLQLSCQAAPPMPASAGLSYKHDKRHPMVRFLFSAHAARCLYIGQPETPAKAFTCGKAEASSSNSNYRTETPAVTPSFRNTLHMWNACIAMLCEAKVKRHMNHTSAHHDPSVLRAM